jgi:hypothetical protein
MTGMGIEATMTGKAVRSLLLSRLDGAYRLPTCILRDQTAAGSTPDWTLFGQTATLLRGASCWQEARSGA